MGVKRCLGDLVGFESLERAVRVRPMWSDCMKIFLAGATGAIGRRLVPLLLNARHYVIGTTRSITKVDGLRAAGVDPVVVDAFDAQALSAAVLEAHPDIIVHQLTDLPPGLDPTQMAV